MPVFWYWPFEPVVLIGAELAAMLYLIGGSGVRTPRFRVWAFWGALATILLALQTPIDGFARQLFWVHMVQHLLLMVVAAPLVAIASPWTRMWRALPRSWRRAVARPLFKSARLQPLRRAYHWISGPAVVWCLAAGNLWLWHVPALYDLTLRNHFVHHLEHALFLGTSIALWAYLVDQHPFRSPLSALGRATYVFAAMVESWALAAVLSFASAPFYAYSLLPSRPGGISALTDQQIGGGIMWVPGAVTYSIAFVVFLFQWLDDNEAPAAQAVEARPTLGG